MSYRSEIGPIKVTFNATVEYGTSEKQLNDILLSIRRYPFVRELTLKIGEEKKSEISKKLYDGQDSEIVIREFASE